MAQDINHRDIKYKEQIGKGRHTFVHKAEWDNKTVAVKKYNTSELFSHAILSKGYSDLLCVDKQNILRFYGISETTGFFNSSTFLLMEHADCGSLHQQIYGSKTQRYQITAALNWMHQCAQGVEFLHSIKPAPIVHHNLKPHNLFLTNNFQQLKIGEMALHPQWLTQQLTYQETMAYMPPEGWLIDLHAEKYDVFSFGVVLWEVLTRRVPLYNRNSYHPEITYLPENTACDNQSIKSLIKSCWQLDPANRPQMATIVTRIDSFMSLFIDKSIVFKIEDMEVSEVIGSGAYGIVYKSQLLCVRYALKKFVIEDVSANRYIDREVKYLSQATHKNIIKLYGTMLSNDSRTMIVMEFADCGTLFKHLHDGGVYDCCTALNWMHQLAQGLQYLHSMKPKPIIHRDIKTKNLLLANNYQRLKIGDFGTVTEMATLMTQTVGTAEYMAPEVTDGKKYTEKSDVYSFGIVFWEVMSQKKPFYHLGNKMPLTIFNKVSQGERPPIDDVKYYPNRERIQQTIKKCWNMKSKKRLSMTDVEVTLTIDLHRLQFNS